MEFLTGIMIAALIFYSGILIKNGELEINNFFSFLAAMMLEYQPVRSLATINILIQQGLAGAKRVLPVIDDKQIIFDRKDAKNLEIKIGKISFENVRFQYNKDENQILDSINLKILSTKSKIKFLYKEIVLISKVIDGKFPDYEKVIPQDERVEAKSNVDEFVSALDRLKSLSSDRKGVIKISLNSGIMKFLINDAISGDGIEEVQTQYKGQPLEIGFNSNYLIDVASVLESKEIVLMLKDATSPIQIKDENDSLSTYIIMPMRVL